VSSNTKTTPPPSNTYQDKHTLLSNLERSFEENLEENREEYEEDISHQHNANRVKTLKEQEKRCLDVVTSTRYKEKVSAKEEEAIAKKQLEEKRRIQVMIQVLNDISKKFPYFLYYLHVNKRNQIVN
jgi:hypothetical protein